MDLSAFVIDLLTGIPLHTVSIFLYVFHWIES